MRIALVIPGVLLLALVENDGWTWELLRSDEVQEQVLGPPREGASATKHE